MKSKVFFHLVGIVFVICFRNSNEQLRISLCNNEDDDCKFLIIKCDSIVS